MNNPKMNQKKSNLLPKLYKPMHLYTAYMQTFDTNKMKSAVGVWARLNDLQADSVIQEEWFLIDGIEYRFSLAFASERINLLYRYPGEVSNTYPILYANDYDVILKDIKNWK
jgi:hypothetical protein